MADDVDAPHDGVIDVPDDADLSRIARTVARSGYLPWSPFGTTSWSVAAGGAIVLFGWRWAFPFAYRLGRTMPLARDLPMLWFEYHAQRPLAEVRDRLTMCLADGAIATG